MTEPAYERLADALNARGGAIPGVKCREFYALMEALFDPDEAALATSMPFNPVTAQALAAETGGDPEEVERTLETMASKGLVFSHDRDGDRFYNLMTLLPGIFEMQFMSGRTDERARDLARLFDEYFQARTQPSVAASAPHVGFPFARVIAVETEIPAGFEVHPYDKVSDYIASADHIAVGVCYCRHHGELVGRPCDRPKEVCMSFGPSALYVSERGFGRLLSREEAMEVLDLSEKAGLVHCSSNTGKYLDFICNCCGCHCGILRSIKNSPPGSGAHSSFVVAVDEGQCIGCGDCIERCWMDALSLDGDTVSRDAGRCIGCGLCVSACPSGALALELRQDAPVPPYTSRELGAKLLSSRHQPGEVV